MWVKTITSLDIDIIAPQHGAVFPNRDMAGKLIDWVDQPGYDLERSGDPVEISQ